MNEDFLVLKSKTRFSGIIQTSLEDLDILYREGLLTPDEIKLFQYDDFYRIYIEFRYPELRFYSYFPVIALIVFTFVEFPTWRDLAREQEKLKETSSHSNFFIFHDLMADYPKDWAGSSYELLPQDQFGKIYTSWKKVYGSYLNYLKYQETISRISSRDFPTELRAMVLAFLPFNDLSNISDILCTNPNSVLWKELFNTHCSKFPLNNITSELVNQPTDIYFNMDLYDFMKSNPNFERSEDVYSFFKGEIYSILEIYKYDKDDGPIDWSSHDYKINYKNIYIFCYKVMEIYKAINQEREKWEPEHDRTLDKEIKIILMHLAEFGLEIPILKIFSDYPHLIKEAIGFVFSEACMFHHYHLVDLFVNQYLAFSSNKIVGNLIYKLSSDNNFAMIKYLVNLYPKRFTNFPISAFEIS